MDFGFDPDPAAVLAMYWYNGGYILDEKLYQTQLLNEHLAASLTALPKGRIVADSAEPKSIADLQTRKLNVIPCEKGTDSVEWGHQAGAGAAHRRLVCRIFGHTKQNGYVGTIGVRYCTRCLRITDKRRSAEA